MIIVKINSNNTRVYNERDLFLALDFQNPLSPEAAIVTSFLCILLEIFLPERIMDM